MTLRIPTRAEWDAMEPYAKGFASYTFSAHPGSEIPSEGNNPFTVGSKEHSEFTLGVQAAVLTAAESED